MSSTPRRLLLRYHEIALKGANRRWFEERLAINARKLLLRTLPGKDIAIEFSRGRIYLNLSYSDSDEAAVHAAMGRAFGLASYSPIREVPTRMDAINAGALEAFESRVDARGRLPERFRVVTRRSDKALPQTSIEIDREVGGFIHAKYPSLVADMEDPEIVVGVEIRNAATSIWTERFAGPGGLPTGTHGRMLALISGGIDSPVAAIRTLRRGPRVSFVHFYGTPFIGEAALLKVRDLVELANRYQPDPEPLYVVPFGKIQEKIALATHPRMRTVLYRRMMLRIAERIAHAIGASALVTGESLGQVASQTIDNLTTIDGVTEIPVLRPLVAYDKDEIIAEAMRWGTYETSIQPAEDCCTLFADRHPATRVSPRLAEEQETKIDIEALIQEGMSQLEVHAASGRTFPFSTQQGLRRNSTDSTREESQAPAELLDTLGEGILDTPVSGGARLTS